MRSGKNAPGANLKAQLLQNTCSKKPFAGIAAHPRQIDKHKMVSAPNAFTSVHELRIQPAGFSRRSRITAIPETSRNRRSYAADTVREMARTINPAALQRCLAIGS